jgi:hypothetical protein
MKDSEFLDWIADRLVHVYGDKPNVDFIIKLRSMAKNIDQDQEDACHSRHCPMCVRTRNY